MSNRMAKKELLEHWNALPENLPIVDVIQPQGERGSNYGADQIRIGGSPQFIDAVLSRLKDMLVLENGQTRLVASHNVVQSKEINGEHKSYQFSGNCVVYLGMMERGPEAQVINAIIDHFASKSPE